MSRCTVLLLAFVWSSGTIAQGQLMRSHDPALPAAVTAPATPSSKAVARVNGVVLTQAELKAEMERIFPYYKMHGGKVPDGAQAKVRKQALDQIVMNELAYQEAQKRGLPIEAEYRKGLREVRQDFKSQKEYEAAIVKKFGSVEKFERLIRRKLLMQRLWDAEVVKKSAVTDQDVSLYYRTNRARFLRPERVTLQSITISIPKVATSEQKQKAKARAEAILPRARAAKNYEEFGVLAEEVSEDDWRVMMGDHKWVHRGTFDSSYENQIFAMKTGEVSRVVESPTGYHIFRVNGHEPQKQLTLAEVQARVRTTLQQERREKRAQQFEQYLRKNAKVEIL